MPLWELGLRSALEIGVLILLWQLALGITRALSRRGRQVQIFLCPGSYAFGNCTCNATQASQHAEKLAIRAIACCAALALVRLCNLLEALTAVVKQAIKEQIEAGDTQNVSIWRVVTDAAAIAVQSPARWFIPLVAVANMLRTATLALQIVAESNLPVRMHWVASECDMLMANMLCISQCCMVMFLDPYASWQNAGR